MRALKRRTATPWILLKFQKRESKAELNYSMPLLIP